MAFVLLTLWGSVMLILARWICGRWFNHLAIYTLVWTVGLFTVELRLIAYHHIVPEAWFYIFLAWVSLYMGSALVKLISPRRRQSHFPELDMKRLRFAIVALSLAGLVSSAALARDIVRVLNTDGILVALTSYANDVYRARFEGDASGLMYLDFLPYAGCLLAGIYTARLGRITFTATLPVFAMLLASIISMQKFTIFVAGALFSFAWSLTPKNSKLHIPHWQKAAVISTILGVCIFIWMHRGGGGGAEFFDGETQTLAEGGDSVSVLPILYLSLSGPIVVFSEYLKHPEEDGKPLVGRYIFSSIYRFLSKLGFDTYVPYYQHFYYTPPAINVGTYLREIHSDFGGTAMLFYPFGLGFLITFLEVRGPGIYSVILLAMLYFMVLFSLFANFIGAGGWYFPLPIALVIAAIVRVRNVRAPEAFCPATL